ncbi:MAG TPA: carbon storage regulator CsrA [Candidatus Cybelea sp.]|jgi:carbon storage regulator
MLVLTRKSNQSIMIGSEIRVTVVGFDGDQVKIGIEAPRDVVVRRSEIYDQLHEKNEPDAAAQSPAPVGKGSAGADTPS